MPTPVRSLLFRAVLLAVLGLAVTGPCARAAERWLRGQSDHFELLSSASEKNSRRLLVELERFRENALTMFPAPMLRESKVTIVFFGSDSGFEPYKPLYKGETKRVAGYFIDQPDQAFIAVSADSNAGYEEVIFHEYVHFLVRARGMNLPTWLNEGLAEVFSTFHMDGTGAEYGRPKDNHVERMSQSALMSVERLLAGDLVEHTAQRPSI
ncbi:MAG: hypothetical protein NTV51_13175 [Verrucomicrobia bacterium]|nr:hypothetical protein [Verrucomicrobiota bacterium]